MRTLLVYYAWGLQLIRYNLHNSYALLLPLTKLFHVFKIKALAQIHQSMLSSLKDHSFTFIVESVYLSPSTLRSKHLCELCIDSYILAYCTCYITLCWQYPWDIHVISWKQPLKLNLPLCCFNASTMNLLLYELTLMQDLLMLVLKVLFMKSLCYMIQLFTHCIYIASNRCIHLICFTILLIKIMLVACHLRNYSCYRLPTRGRVGTKLGDAWYVSNISIISYVPC